MTKHSSLKWFYGVLLASLLVFSPPICEGKTIIIKYSDHDPPGGMRTDFLKEVWLPEIVKQTGGKVKIQDFWGGALLGSKEILKGIADRVTDMGFVYPGHYPGQLPAFTIFKLFPRGPSKFENMVWFYRKVYEEIPEFKAELKAANQKTLLFTAGLPGAFTSTKPLRSLDDLKGHKWRAGDKWALRFLKNAGAIPVSVPWGDVYMALQTGTIEGCFTNYDGLHMMKFDEVAPNLLISKALWFATPFIHNVNLDFWDSLPKDIQDGILKASEIAEKKFAETYEKAFDKIMAEQKAAGFKVTVMSEEDVLKWENAKELRKMQEQWVEEAKAAGLKNASSIMEQMRKIHKQAMEREK
jgi:TRAP-type C4-dicarboxylate transport system substrate-binding protein